MHAADLGGALGIVRFEVFPQQLENGRHGDPRAVCERHLVAPGKRRIDVTKRERSARRLDHLSAARIEDVELLVAPARFQIALAQEMSGVGARQERQVRLLFDEGGVVDAFVDDHLAHRQGPRGIRPGLHRQVVIDQLRRRAAVRCEDDDLGAVVPRLRSCSGTTP